MTEPAPCTEEARRLLEDHLGTKPWKKWGPYVSDRQWGTVREDYSPHGNAWEYFPHDHARSRAYRWGEDGIAGVCDVKQRLCLGLVLWNGRDPILKERFFGLTNGEGNHGEDVKELYYYLDATPTHSYLKMLYKYPQRAFPYDWLVEENRRRGKDQPEFELLDTGIFDDDRYFDVFVEYAKAGPEDVLLRITVHNRGPEAATLHVLPQLWFRNTWTWKNETDKPRLSVQAAGVIEAVHPKFGTYCLHAEHEPQLLFCDNETNVRRHFNMTDARGCFKDAFHDYLIHGDHHAVNPDQHGTKAAAVYKLTIPARDSAVVRVRLRKGAPAEAFADFNNVMAERIQEADAFYADLQCKLTTLDAKHVQRQALAGMIWCKQFYDFDVPHWLRGDPGQPEPPRERRHGRNADWMHVNNGDVISMPDKWEYPWFAAWDLAFHSVAFALIDVDFAKDQLLLLTREWYMHPNGQLPAYEWAFGDVNPPVHAWAAWRVFMMDRAQRPEGDPGDIDFLERIFHKLMLNFTWWVNRKDAQGRNIFQGGFLGLDNIGVFDRSAPLPTGGFINQADGTSWMAMYSLNLMRIALELALHNHVYEDIATKFFEHFLQIAEAMTAIGGSPGVDAPATSGAGLWDEEDQFYFDQLNLPNGERRTLKVFSMVGLIPLFAVQTMEPELLAQVPEFSRRLQWYFKNRPDLAGLVSRWHEPGRGERRLLSLLRGHRMKELLKRMLDETRFLADHGVRALSRHHRDHPYKFQCDGTELTVAYQPGESESGLFGGNSNWRGPIWFPVNFLIIESLERFYTYYGDDFTVECPTGTGQYVSLKDVASELTRRLSRLFLRGADGRRPVYGSHPKLQFDPHFRDHLQFFEYFHGDTGEGLGASHQTGWTGLVANLLMPYAAPTFWLPPDKDGKPRSVPHLQKQASCRPE